ncbi:zinc finger protein 835-like isoform X1 [Mugil cephalus]|uniref:zinc finger protein 835-like isoform X1 n=1 Tax=Mugil cephalus TaxID=48193 RepID=UPI001FB7FCCC|nr:zinc finger protein 835-like isoform X1 [Mugil cephalus]
MGDNAAEGLGEMSKAEVLRGFVTERLAAASREILAVVDTIVAAYEEEASGYKETIDRQGRQLELLQPDAKCSRSLNSDEEEDCEDEQPQEHLENLDVTGPSRSFQPRCRYRRRKMTSRSQISETQKGVELRIRILEDSQTSVLSKHVLKKCPILRLKCPCGLQEEDFVDLLRSTFPQLSGDEKTFDILTADKRRRLQLLKLKKLTPEEIHRYISSSTFRTSTVCVRLKTQKKTRVTVEETDNNPDMKTVDEGGQQASSPVQEDKGSRVHTVSNSSVSPQQDVGTEEVNDEEPAAAFVLSSAAELKEDDSNDNQKPDRSGEEQKKSHSKPKMMKKLKARRSDVIEESVHSFSCRVCGALHTSEVMLVKHTWSHADDPGSVCGVCGESSESMEELKDHLQSRHKTDDCHVCGQSFVSVHSLNEHVAAHLGEKPYKCNVCHRSFALEASLKDHRKLHEVGKPHKCYTCHKVFELKEQLKVHRNVHSKRKSHLCGVCGKSLSDYRSLCRHKMTHSGERPHSCKICGRSFKLPGTLKQHEKIHTNRERSYLCDVCCKMFLTSQQLQIHMRRHTNEKPYHCGECGRGFSTKGPLTVHMRVHTGEAPYRCPDCGWAFKRKTNLDGHVALHSGLKPFVCGICGKACARKTYLTVHMRTHNGERPYKCTQCDKAFTQSHSLKTHMKSHQGVQSS